MKYRIKPGHSFRDSDNTIKTGGDQIELDDEAAKAHADKVDRIEEPVPGTIVVDEHAQ